jgi:polar amino acid transport system substrate-binding protein
MKKYSAQATRRTVLTTAAAVAALALTSCSAAAPTASTEKKTVTIGIGNEAPFAFTESGSESLSGLDGEMLSAVAEAKGWKIKTFVTDFATLIPALTAKKADVIVDGMFITDKRKEQVNFTDPLYLQPEGMIVPAGSTLTSKEDVKGKVIGAQTGTVYGEWVKTLGGSDVKFVDTQAALITAVENGQVDAAFTDSAVIGYSLVQKPNSKIKLVSPYEPHFQGIIGAGVRKEDTQLLADLNAGLVELKKSPKYLEILKKYGLGEENASK